MCNYVDYEALEVKLRRKLDLQHIFVPKYNVVFMHSIRAKEYFSNHCHELVEELDFDEISMFDENAPLDSDAWISQQVHMLELSQGSDGYVVLTTGTNCGTHDLYDEFWDWYCCRSIADYMCYSKYIRKVIPLALDPAYWPSEEHGYRNMLDLYRGATGRQLLDLYSMLDVGIARCKDHCCLKVSSINPVMQRVVILPFGEHPSYAFMVALLSMLGSYKWKFDKDDILNQDCDNTSNFAEPRPFGSYLDQISVAFLRFLYPLTHAPLTDSLAHQAVKVLNRNMSLLHGDGLINRHVCDHNDDRYIEELRPGAFIEILGLEPVSAAVTFANMPQDRLIPRIAPTNLINLLNFPPE